MRLGLKGEYMPVLRSAVNGLAIGILSSTRIVIQHYKNGTNNNYIWGNQPVAINKVTIDEPVKIETSLDNGEGSIEATEQPTHIVPEREAISAAPSKTKRKGRTVKEPVVNVVEEDPAVDDTEVVQSELAAVLEEKGIV